MKARERGADVEDRGEEARGERGGERLGGRDAAAHGLPCYAEGVNLAQMLRRLTTLLTIALVAATTLAGSALQAGSHRCPMYAAMDCCANEQTAAAEASPEVKAARLICALNCQQPAPTAPGFKVSQPQPAQAQPQSVVAGAPAAPPQPPAHARAPSTHARAPGSQPAYIRHLALLI